MLFFIVDCEEIFDIRQCVLTMYYFDVQYFAVRKERPVCRLLDVSVLTKQVWLLPPTDGCVAVEDDLIVTTLLSSELTG
jgi:hypothetical protein